MLGDGGRLGWTARRGQGAMTGEASLAPGWHSGPPELLLVSRLGDGVGGRLHQPTWPLGSPAIHGPLHQSLKRDCPLLWEGVTVCPQPLLHWLPLGRFPYCAQSHSHLSLPLFGSPAASPNPPTPACRPGPDTFLLPDPQPPTHTALWTPSHSLVRTILCLRRPSFSEVFCFLQLLSKSELVAHSPWEVLASFQRRQGQSAKDSSKIEGISTSSSSLYLMLYSTCLK